MSSKGKGFFTILVSMAIISMMLVQSGHAEDQELAKQAEESWQQLFDSTVVNIKNEGLTKEWKTFADKYNRLPEAARAAYMVGETLYQQGFYNKAKSAFEEFGKKYPHKLFSDSAYYRIGECFYNRKEYKTAIAKWDELLRRYSGTFYRAEALYGQILSYIALKKWREASAKIGELTDRYPYYRKEKKVKMPLGLVYYHNKQYAQALQYFQSIDGAMATYYVGQCLDKLNRFLPAAASYKKVVENFPDSIYALDAAFNKADSYYKGENYPVAVTEFKTFLKKYPQSKYNNYAHYKLGVSEMRQEDYKKAMVDFDKLLAAGGQDSDIIANALYLKGECLRNLKQYEKAIAVYTKVGKQYPNTYVAGSAKFKSGWVMLRTDHSKQALQTFRQFLSTYPVHEDVQLATYLLANSYFKQEIYVQAIPIYQNILMKYKYSDVSDAALAALEMAYYIPKQYEQLISTTHYILKVLAANFPPSKSIWRSLSYFYLAEAYYHMGMFSQAADQYKKITDNFSDSPVLNWARLGLSYSYFELGKYDKAKRTAKDLAEAEDVDPKLVTYATLMQAHSLFNNRKYEDAIVKYEDFARNNPKMKEAGDAYFYAGQAYYQLEYYANAIDAWNKVVTYYKKSEKAPEAAYKMADTFFKAQQYDKAIAAYQMLKQWPEEDNPYHKDIQLHVAQCYYNAKQDDMAIAAYKKFINEYPEDPKVKDAIEGIQLSYYRKGASADAVPQLMEFVTKFPNSRLAIDALYRVGEIYYQEKNLKQCVAAFQQLIADYPESSLLPNAQYYIAICDDAAGDKDKALRSYRAFIRNFPDHELVVDVRFRLATGYFNKEEYDKAIEVYQEIVDLHAKSDYAPNALYNIALCYKKMKKWRQAIEEYTEFYKKFPDDSKAKDALLQIANTYRDEKRYPSAIKIYREMVGKKDFADQKNEILYSIADAYMNMEDKKNAAKALEDVRKIRPVNNIYRLTGLAKLGSLYEELEKWGPAYDVYQDLAGSGAQPQWKQAAKARMAVIRAEHASEVNSFMKNKASKSSVSARKTKPSATKKRSSKKTTHKKSKKK